MFLLMKNGSGYQCGLKTQLVNFKDDEHVLKVARNAGEACQLVETGFEYVAQHRGHYAIP